jgi:hypothetical protein
MPVNLPFIHTMASNVSFEVGDIINLATGHQPTSTQVQSWTAALQNGTVSVKDMVDSFIESSAFEAHFGLSSPANPNAVTGATLAGEIIHDATGMVATAGQLAAWGAQSIEHTFESFAANDTYLSHEVPVLGFLYESYMF